MALLHDMNISVKSIEVEESDDVSSGFIAVVSVAMRIMMRC